MSVTTTLTFLKQNVLDLLFPILCFECGFEGAYLCEPCRLKLKTNEFQICPVCGKPSPFGATHIECKTKFSLDGLVSAVAYKEPLVRKLVESCKYKFISDITNVMAQMIAIEVMNQELLSYFNNFILVPLPLHPSRLKWRGFNQAELIAQRLSLLLKLNIQRDLLIRKKKTHVQAELSDDKRVINVKDAFHAPHNIANKKIILIDDVSTTRSTLSEACLALKKSGIQEVWALTFAQG